MVGVCVSAVGGKKFGPSRYLVTKSRYEMPVTSRSEKTFELFGTDITVEDAHNVIFQLEFAADRLRQVQAAIETQFFGDNIAVKLPNGGNAQYFQHFLFDLRHAVGHVRMNKNFRRQSKLNS
jgi:hypothetical protein